MGWSVEHVPHFCEGCIYDSGDGDGGGGSEFHNNDLYGDTIFVQICVNIFYNLMCKNDKSGGDCDKKYTNIPYFHDNSATIMIKPILQMITILFFALSLPKVDFAQVLPPDTVSAGIYITSIHDIDFKQKEYVVNCWLWLKYKNQEFNFIDNLEIPQAKSITKSFSTVDTTDGQIFLMMKLQCVMKDSWKIDNFPFDNQKLRLSVENSQYDVNTLIFKADTAGNHYDPRFALSGWRRARLTRLGGYRHGRGRHGLGRYHLGAGARFGALRVASFGDEAAVERLLDPFFDVARRHPHHLGHFRDDERLGAVEHPLLAEREALRLGQERETLEHVGHVGNRAAPHLVGVVLEAALPVRVVVDLAVAEFTKQTLDLFVVNRPPQPDVVDVSHRHEHRRVV